MTKEGGDNGKKEASISNTTPQFQCPMLKPANYSSWAIRMQIIEEAPGNFINQEESRSKNGRKFHSTSN